MVYATLKYEPPSKTYWQCPYCGKQQPPDFTPIRREKYDDGRVWTIYGATCCRCDSTFTTDEHNLEEDLNYKPRNHRLRVVG